MTACVARTDRGRSCRAPAVCTIGRFGLHAHVCRAHRRAIRVTFLGGIAIAGIVARFEITREEAEQVLRDAFGG